MVRTVQGILAVLALAGNDGAADPVSCKRIVINCGPDDVAFFHRASDDAGAINADWVPVDGSVRSTGWSHAARQFLDYRVGDLNRGLYRITATVCAQKGFCIALSIAANGALVAKSDTFQNPGPRGYLPWMRMGIVDHAGGPLAIRLEADKVAKGDRIRAVRLEIVSLDELIRDGNVARIATVKTDSDLGTEYPQTALIDGLTEYAGTTRGRSWASREVSGDHWVVFELPRVETIARVTLYWPRYPDRYNTARDVRIQRWQNDVWQDVACMETPVGMPCTTVQLEPFKARRVRLLMPDRGGPAHRPNVFWMNEVQLHRPSAPTDVRDSVPIMTATVSGPGTARLATALDASKASAVLAGRDATPGLLWTVYAEDRELGRVVVDVEGTCLGPGRQDVSVYWDGERIGALSASGANERCTAKCEAMTFRPGRRHTIVLAAHRVEPKVRIDTVRLTARGRFEFVSPSDVRVAPRSYKCTPRMTDAELFAALDLTRPGLGGVRIALAEGRMDRAKEALVKHIRTRTRPPRLRPSRGELVRPDVEPPRKMAERFLRHEYYLYKDRRWHSLGEVINWYLPQGDQSDRHYIARVPLMPYMIDRWAQDRDDRYLEGYIDTYRQFWRNAPSPADPPVFPSSHLPWCGMCSAIRITNVMGDYFRFCDAPILSVDDQVMFYKSILEHARFLMKCDGRRFFAGNHQMGHLLALERIAAAFPEFRECAEWRPYLQEMLRRHLKRDTFPDGGSVDTATGYGIWVATVLFTDAYVHSRHAGIDLGDAWLERLEKMYEWCIKVTAPAGGQLAIGDANFRLDDAGNQLGRTMVAVKGTLLFDRPDFKYFCADVDAAVVRELAGRLWPEDVDRHVERFVAVKPQPPAFTSANLPNTGWTIMRTDWTASANYMFVNHHRGGHTHKTQSDFNVIAYDRAFITDAGIPHTYRTPRWQGWYVKTVAHNTVLVDGQDMAPGRGPPGEWFSSPAFDYLSLTHDCYKKLGISAHTRQILFVKPDVWIIHDALAGKGHHTFEWLAHFQPMPLRVNAEAGTVRTANETGPNLAVVAASPKELRVEQRRGWMNVPTTQICEEVDNAPYIALVQKAMPPVWYGVLLHAVKTGRPTASIEALAASPGGHAYRIKAGPHHGIAVFSDGRPVRRTIGGVETDARAVYVSAGPEAPWPVCLVSGTALVVNGTPIIELQSSGSLSAHRTGSGLVIETSAKGCVRFRDEAIQSVWVNGTPKTVTRQGSLTAVQLD